MEDTQLAQALQARQDGAMERFQTAYTPLLQYIIAPILPDEREHTVPLPCTKQHRSPVYAELRRCVINTFFNNVTILR